MNVLYLNSTNPVCGVYQFGVRVYKALKASSRYRVSYAEVDDVFQCRRWRDNLAPSIVVYNHHWAAMPWLTPAVLAEREDMAHVALYHEAGGPTTFDYYIYADPSLKMRCRNDGRSLWLRTVRPLPKCTCTFETPAIPTIGSFGLGVCGKQYEAIVAQVNGEFDQAIVNINIPTTKAEAARLAGLFQAQITKPGIKLNISYGFMDEPDLLGFLGRNTINVFHYGRMGSNGVSSATDYALAVRRPLAITKHHMFRHIWARAPEICLEAQTLPEIIEMGLCPLRQFHVEWTKKNLLHDMEMALDRVVKERAK